MNTDEEELPLSASELPLPVRPAASILIASLAMALLVGCVYVLKVPNPNILLLSGLVVCSTLFGYPGGIVAGVFTVTYSFFFFSAEHDFVTFTPQNQQKVIVSILGVIADAFFICHLKWRNDRAYGHLRKLTMLLQEDNRLLERASQTDPLTELGNRFALRSSFSKMAGQEVVLLILDVDDFKSINDSYGHDLGDRCLQETGRRLSELFGQENAYRFGGDEFVVLCQDASMDSFKQTVCVLVQDPPVLSLEGDTRQIPLRYSVGYVWGHCRGDEDIHRMFRQADEELYRSKNSGKGQSHGKGYHPVMAG